MPLKFEIKKRLISRSERVKCVDIHPENPWVLVSLYSGNVTIYDYSNQTTVKTFENSLMPVRSAKFIVRKQWIVVGSDDLQIRVYNYNTMEKIQSFEAHTDYIRCVIVHQTLPYILTSSDDSTIKLWDFEKGFKLVKTYEDHIHYVMMIAFNPRDSNVFCSGSMDRTIKVWTVSGGTNKPNFTLTGHVQGINCIDYHKGDKPYIISGSDDRQIKIWDYQTKQCIHTLESHQNNLSVTLFHPELPIIITGSEDGVVKFWHSVTYKLETTLNYNLERVWSIDIGKENSNIIAIGYDEGTVVIKIGSDEPVVSMNNGKLVWAKNLEINSANLKAVNVNDENLVKDGETIDIQRKELGTCDYYPIGLRHSANGHLFALYDDFEYTIYKSQSFKSCGFGQGTDLVWSQGGEYAVRDNYLIKLFDQNNAQYIELKTDYQIEGLFGGPVLGAKSNEFVIFYDWKTGKLIRKIDIVVKNIYWNDDSTQVSIVSTEDFYILQYQAKVVKELIEQEENPEGYEQAFDLSFEIHDIVTSAIWIEGVFYFTNTNGKINYTVMGKVFNFAHTDKKKFIIGYIAAQQRLYLFDRNFNVISFELLSTICKYQSLVGSSQLEGAEQLLQKIPEKHYDKLAKFLDQVDLKKEAFQIVKDSDHKFELALSLGNINAAYEIAKQQQKSVQLKQVGDLSLMNGKIDLAITCFKASDDLGSLLLICVSLGLKSEIEELAKKAQQTTRMNIAFICFFILNDLQQCINILLESQRYPEAAMFAKTYLPSQITKCVELWKDYLKKNNFNLTAQKIADPMDYINDSSFSDLNILLKIEKFQKQIADQKKPVPSHYFEAYKEKLKLDLFNMLKQDPNLDLEKVNLFPDITDEVNPLLHLENLGSGHKQAEEEQQTSNLMNVE